MSSTAAFGPLELASRYTETRELTMRLATDLSVEDQQVQSMVDASPVKWHKAHTTWFFETFILTQIDGYNPFAPRFRELYNSYYVQIGPRCLRRQRGLVTRPSLGEVHEYRLHVDAAITKLLGSGQLETRDRDLIWLGLQHEQQHQELLLMDVQHLLAQNPLDATYRQDQPAPRRAPIKGAWITFEGGLVSIGHEGPGFAYDHEGPRHHTFLEPYSLATHPISNAQWLEFVQSGAYEDPRLWLDDAWSLLQENVELRSPMYWRQRDNTYEQFTLHGWEPLRLEDPVVHISYYEADAFARWNGQRLPTEIEWEHAAQSVEVAGNFAEDGEWYPRCALSRETKLSQVFGDAWEWTASAYSAYPGFRVADGAVGEYNGKFMVNQFVLRGGSFATPHSHIRRTYRNFFHPSTRWHFGGLRLAKI